MRAGSGSSGLLLGMASGAAIWLLSPVLADHPEPWDTSGAYYPLALLLAGALGGWVNPGQMGRVVTGVVAGQALVLLGRVVSDPSGGGLWPLGILFLALYSVPALVGAVVAAALRRRHERPESARRS